MTIAAIAHPPHRWSSPLAIAVIGAIAVSSTSVFAVGPFAYLPSHDDPNHTISVVDLSNTAAAPATFNVTGQAVENSTGFYGVALSRKDGMLYVSDENNETVFQINTATGASVASYFVGTTPRGIAVDPSGKHVYVANFASTGVSIIDTHPSPNTNPVTQVDFSTLSGIVSPSPSGVALNLAGTHLYVTDASTGQRLCRINTVSPPTHLVDTDCVPVAANPDTGADANAVAVSPDDTRVYVINHVENSISIVDTASFNAGAQPVVTTIRFGTLVPNGDFGSPNAIAVSTSGKRAYVSSSLGKILVLDLTRIGTNPFMTVIHDDTFGTLQGLSMSPDGKHLLAADTGNPSVLHFVNVVNDANVRDASVPVHQSPVAIGNFTQADAIFVSGSEG